MMLFCPAGMKKSVASVNRKKRRCAAQVRPPLLSSIRDVRIGRTKIECRRRAIDRLAVAIEGQREFAHAQFIANADDEVDEADMLHPVLIVGTGPKIVFEPHRQVFAHLRAPVVAAIRA
jgi:hypothetical protein